MSVMPPSRHGPDGIAFHTQEGDQKIDSLASSADVKPADFNERRLCSRVSQAYILCVREMRGG